MRSPPLWCSIKIEVLPEMIFLKPNSSSVSFKWTYHCWLAGFKPYMASGDRADFPCWVYACTKVNPNEFLSLILHFMLLFHSFYYSNSFLWVPIFPYIFLYFIFLYLRMYSRRSTSHLLPLRGYVRAPTFRSEPTTQQAFASAHRDSFASTIPTCLHLLDVGLPNTFLRVVGGVETRAAYDLIGKSWPGARYMCGEPRNTLSISSVLDHHWGGELWSTSSIVFLLIVL